MAKLSSLVRREENRRELIATAKKLADESVIQDSFFNQFILKLIMTFK